MSVAANNHTYSALLDPITIIEADITTLDVNAIANATKEALLPNGGVCGAIHAAAGPGLMRTCKSLAPCPTDEGSLAPFRIRHVIHRVWNGGDHGEPELLASCYRNSVALAQNIA